MSATADISRVEPGRLDRGAKRPVRKVGPRQYVVAGTHAPWYVDLEQGQPCTCEDATYRARERVGPCLHEIAARLQEHDPKMIAARVAALEPRVRGKDE